MKRVNAGTEQKIRELCRNINHEANDHEKLKTLVIRLQQALTEERRETHTVQMVRRAENPFDKIMV